MLVADRLLPYRHDSGFPQYPSSMANGYFSGVSIFTKPLVDFTGPGGPANDNPAIIQNQNPNPRDTPVATSAGITIYKGFDSKAFMVLGFIVLAIWFLAK